MFTPARYDRGGAVTLPYREAGIPVNDRNSALSKVPAVTLGFWIIKIAATTLGETGGDTVTMTMDLGYLKIGRAHV